MYSAISVSALSLFALSAALFRVDARRDEQSADERRASAHRIARREETVHVPVRQAVAPASSPATNRRLSMSAGTAAS